MAISPWFGKIKFEGLVKMTRHALLFADKREVYEHISVVWIAQASQFGSHHVL